MTTNDPVFCYRIFSNLHAAITPTIGLKLTHMSNNAMHKTNMTNMLLFKTIGCEQYMNTLPHWRHQMTIALDTLTPFLPWDLFCKKHALQFECDLRFAMLYIRDTINKTNK